MCASAGPFLADLGGEHRAKSVPPEPDRLGTDFDTALVQQILHIPKRKREADVHHKSMADDIGGRFEITKWAAFCHPPKLDRHPARLKPVSADKAPLPSIIRPLTRLIWLKMENLC